VKISFWEKFWENWEKSEMMAAILIGTGTFLMYNILMKQYLPNLPPDLTTILDGHSCEKNLIGCSSAEIYRYHKAGNAFYLKIARADEEIRREHGLLLWLNGKLPVPEVAYWCEQNGLAYLLMTEVPGRMACNCPEDTVAEPIANTVQLLANGLLMLQAVDTADCPFDNALDKKLAQALCHIENNLVNMGDWEENNRFGTPMDLYKWLAANKPPEDLSFTHGDYCLPNIFIDGKAITGFIDAGRGGIADKWQDMALCVRSLGYNLGDIRSAEKDRYISLLFSCLGIKPDREKIEYYILLDELF
jgi:kanamycin kinase/aminoglycoside 3'-phosphotransferase-3